MTIKEQVNFIKLSQRDKLRLVQDLYKKISEVETYKKALSLCNKMNTINASHRPDPNFYTVEDWLSKAKEDK